MSSRQIRNAHNKDLVIEDLLPYWTEAPIWAEFAAMNIDRTWFWFEYKPQLLPLLGCWCGSGQHGSKITFDDQPASEEFNWMHTLHERPRCEVV